MRYIIPAIIVTACFIGIFAQNARIAESTAFKDSFQQSLDETANETGHKQLEGQLGNNLPDSVSRIIKALLGIIGIIFLGLMIYGGYVWMASRGNENEVAKGRTILRNALIGFIIVATAYGITEFVGTTILSGIGQQKQQ